MMLAGRLSEMQEKNRQRQVLEEHIGTLPPSQQVFARMNPQAFAQRQMDIQMPKPEYEVRQLQGPNGPQLAYVPKTPGAGGLQTIEGAAPYRAELDPAVRGAKIDDAVTLEERLDPLKLRRAAASANRITMQPIFKQEGEEAKTVGKFFGDQYADIQKAGFNAQAKISKLDRAAELLSGVNTGKLTPLGTEVAAYMESLGYKVDKSLPNKQAAQALFNEMALELRNPSGGAGMPGALSDKDREFLVSMVPNLSNTPEGNQMLMETTRKLAQRDRQVAQLARDYRKKRGSLDEGFYDVLRQFSEGNPLFGSGDGGLGPVIDFRSLRRQ